MLLLIEHLYLQTNPLLTEINLPSLHRSLNDALNNFWRHVDHPNTFDYLVEIHRVLNIPENVDYLNQIKQRKQLEEINKTVMLLIYDSLMNQYSANMGRPIKREKHQGGTFRKGLFITAAILGTIFAAVDGASIVPSLLTSFTTLGSISNFVLLPAQLAFAGLAVLIFYGLELGSIGKSLGVRAFDLGRVFKLYGKQSRIFKDSFELIQSALAKNDLSDEQNDALVQSYQRLEELYKNFSHKVELAKNAIDNPSASKKVTEKICAVAAAIVWGTVGAIGAQACVPSLLPLFVGSAVATGPLGVTVTISLMAICFVAAAVVYLGVGQRPVREFINKIWGTPSKATQRLIKKDEKIMKTQGNIQGLIKGREVADQLRKENERLKNTMRYSDPKQDLSNSTVFNSQERRENSAESSKSYSFTFYEEPVKPFEDKVYGSEIPVLN
jgi:hypothetical protein